MKKISLSIFFLTDCKFILKINVNGTGFQDEKQ